MAEDRSRSRILADLIAGLTVVNEGDQYYLYDSDWELNVGGRIYADGDIVALGRNFDSDGSGNLIDAFQLDTLNKTIDINNTTFKLNDTTQWYRIVDDSESRYQGSLPGERENRLLKSGLGFDSDLTALINDSYRRFSRDTVDGLSRIPGSINYNPPLQELANEIAIEDMFNVSNQKAPLTGQSLVWTGAQWEPGEAVSSLADRTLHIESAQITDNNSSTIAFQSRLGQHPLVFMNGHLLARDSESMDTASVTPDPLIRGTGVDYTVRDDVLVSTIDQLVSGPADAVIFASPLRQFDEVTTVSPYIESQAKFHSAFYTQGVNDYDFALPTLESPQGVNAASGIVLDPVTDLVTEFPMYPSENATHDLIDRSGFLPVFLNGQLLAPIDAAIPNDGVSTPIQIRTGAVSTPIIPDSDYTLDSENGRIVVLPAGVELQDSDEISIAWVESITQSPLYQWYHWGEMIDSEHPWLDVGGSHRVPILDAVDDPESALVFINGHLLANTPVIEYSISGGNIITSTGFTVGDRIQVITTQGAKSNPSLLGNLGNVDSIVNTPPALSPGEAFVWAFTDNLNTTGLWTHQFSQVVTSTPVPIAWAKVTLGTPNVISTSNFNPESLTVTTGQYELILDSDNVPVNNYAPGDMCIQVTINEVTATPLFCYGRAFDDGKIQVRILNATGTPTDLADGDEINISVWGNRT